MIWRASALRFHALALVLGVLFASYLALYGYFTLIRDTTYRFGDFLMLWAGGRVLQAFPAADLYDPATLQDRMLALGMPLVKELSFPYPPSFLPVVWPLGLLSYDAAYAAFMLATLGGFVVAVAYGSRAWPLLAAAAAIAPTSVITLVAGQSGFLAGALLLGGMRLAPTQPLLGGTLLGLLAYKPQLGLLIPVALIAAGLWRSVVAAGVTVAAVMLATSFTLGWRIWPDWMAYVPDFVAQFERDSGTIDHLSLTLSANLRMLGVATSVMRPAQIVLALVVAVWVWRAFRAGCTPRGLLVLAVAAFLAAPHALIYDLPVLTGAVLLYVADRAASDTGLSGLEVAALTVALVFPTFMAPQTALPPISTACLGLLALALSRGRTPNRIAAATG